jgi:hypothetical protein
MWIGGYETYYINCRGYFYIERCERLIALGELERVIQEALVVCLMIISLYAPGASEEPQSL